MIFGSESILIEITGQSIAVAKCKMNTQAKEKVVLHLVGARTNCSCQNCGAEIRFRRSGMFYIVWCPGCKRAATRDFSLANAVKEFALQ